MAFAAAVEVINVLALRRRQRLKASRAKRTPNA
jgi:hypothetical protein